MQNILGMMIVTSMFQICYGQIPMERTVLDNYTPLLRQFRRFLGSFFGQPTQVARNIQNVRSLDKMQKQIDESVPFPCPLNYSRSLIRPSSVHALRPGDIDIIGAIGDSLTAGFGLTATSVFQIMIENRGMSFSGGGQGDWRTYLTLPNILKEFNPNLYGYAVKDSFTIDEQSRFNVAEGSAISENMPYMAHILVKRMKQNPKVDLQNDWKMVSLSVGANDFCSEICYKPKPESIVQNHKNHLIQVLRILRDNLPRTFVNIIPPPNLVKVSQFTHKPSHCFITHSFECPCIFGLAYARYQKKYDIIIKKWQKIEQEVVDMEEFDTEDFTVVLQPFIVGYKNPVTRLGRTDLTHMSQDCFHLSQKGNAQIANNLWNNLLEPVGQKAKYIVPLFERFNCPTTDHPYLYTRRNSQLQQNSTFKES